MLHAMAVSSVEREHLNLLCVFPREAELKVATVIFEGGTDSTFDLDTRFSQLGLRICRGWKSEPASGELTIGFVSQTKTGSDGCTKRLSQVAECFTPDLVVMAGVCAGAEDLTSGCQHGCVVIVNKATRMGEGIKSKGCKYPNVDAEYVELDSELVSWIAPLTEIEEPEWLKLIPKALWCPSPRSAREMIIKMLDSNPGMPKKRILEECNRIQETKEFGAMNGITWGLILNRMEKDTNPWIKVVDEDLYTLENTKRSISYYNGAHHPLGTDRIQAFLGTMGTMEHQIGDLASEIDDLRPAMGAHSLIAVDQEAYDFIKLCQDRFKQSLCVVVKGISERCISAHGRLTPFQKFAACTPVAWLRFFVTKHQQHLFSKQQFHKTTVLHVVESPM